MDVWNLVNRLCNLSLLEIIFAHLIIRHWKGSRFKCSQSSYCQVVFRAAGSIETLNLQLVHVHLMQCKSSTHLIYLNTNNIRLMPFHGVSHIYLTKWIFKMKLIFPSLLCPSATANKMNSQKSH